MNEIRLRNTETDSYTVLKARDPLVFEVVTEKAPEEWQDVTEECVYHDMTNDLWDAVHHNNKSILVGRYAGYRLRKVRVCNEAGNRLIYALLVERKGEP